MHWRPARIGARRHVLLQKFPCCPSRAGSNSSEAMEHRLQCVA